MLRLPLSFSMPTTIIPYISAPADECLLTGGCESSSPNSVALTFSGMPAQASPAPAVSPAITYLPASSNPFVNPTWDPGATTTNSSGGITSLGYSGGTAAGAVADQLALSQMANKTSWSTSGSQQTAVFTGSDLKVILEVANVGSTQGQIRLSKVLTELTTITVSVHRVKSPARALGYINPKGFARGTRTIAGTMFFTKFGQDVLADFLTSSAFTYDLSKDTEYVKVDQVMSS
jgi:hypothetical protein